MDDPVTARLRVGACLSLSGRFGRFGNQTAKGLETWATLDGAAKLVIEDDQSEKTALGAGLRSMAARCDLLLGPYSTVLMREAGNLAADYGWLVWNHGGSGDDVESAHPGHVVSVLTPTSRYAEPFVRLLAAEDERAWLVVAAGPGSFGRQVTEGAMLGARQAGIGASNEWPVIAPAFGWNLLSAGVFEDDARIVRMVLGAQLRPRRICAVAAGVQAFADAVADPEGIYGIAQWFPGADGEAETGPSEAAFLRAYAGGQRSAPDYPAVQAAAGAAIATRCAQLAGSAKREDLWEAAVALDTSTLFGGFRIDPETGQQLGHETVLVRWQQGEPVLVSQASRGNRES